MRKMMTSAVALMLCLAPAIAGAWEPVEIRDNFGDVTLGAQVVRGTMKSIHGTDDEVWFTIRYQPLAGTVAVCSSVISGGRLYFSDGSLNARYRIDKSDKVAVTLHVADGNRALIFEVLPVIDMLRQLGSRLIKSTRR
jgi:hypothetical protein